MKVLCGSMSLQRFQPSRNLGVFVSCFCSTLLLAANAVKDSSPTATENANACQVTTISATRTRSVPPNRVRKRPVSGGGF